MRIRTENADRLVLEDRPLGMGIFLAVLVWLFAAAAVVVVPHAPRVGLWFLGIAAFWGLMAVLIVRRSVLVLDRTARRAVWHEVTLFGRRSVTLPLSDVDRATVQRRGSASRCALVRPGMSPFPLTEMRRSGGGAGRAAAAINAWLGYEGPSHLPAAGLASRRLRDGT